MNRFRWTAWLGVVSILLAAATAWAESPGDKIAAALAAAPPTAPMTEARREALGALDDWLARPQSDKDPAVVAFYQAAVERALDKMESAPVKSGARIFQLYSSSYIVQTPETVFAFDLVQGPLKDKYLKTTHAAQGVAFRFTDEQFKRIVKLIDYAFFTHEHEDHINLELTEALVKAGKTAVVTPATKGFWKDKPWVNKLTTLPQTVDKPNQLGPLAVEVLWDHQWDDSRHTTGQQCDAFIVTTPDGTSVMVKGDINCGIQLAGWVGMLAKRGRKKVDAFVGSSIFWRGPDTLAECDAALHPVWLPGHNWEFTHRGKTQPKGNCGAFIQTHDIVAQNSGSDKVLTLAWGEWFDVGGKASDR